MTVNPYDAPLGKEPLLQASLVTSKPPRPTGVTILAALHLLGGFMFVVVGLLLIGNMGAMAEGLGMLGVPPALLIAGILFLTLLTLASGIGMWLGTKWGWWLASFYYVYSIFRNASAVVTVLSMADQLEGAARGPEYYVMKHTIRAIVSGLLLMYFCKDNVLDFFGIHYESKIKPIAILVGIALLITILNSAIAWIQ